MSEYYILLLIANRQDEKAKSFIRISDLQDSVDKSGTTFLHWSVEANNNNMVDYLLKKNYDVNAINSIGYTPLMIAVNTNNNEIIKTLLQAGGDIDLVNDWGYSALRLALNAQHVSDEIVQLALNNFCNKCTSRESAAKRLINVQCRLHQAAFSKDARIIDHMLKQGIPIDTTHCLDKRTALHIATSLDDLKTVKLLIKHGINVHALDFEGASAIHYIFKLNLDQNSEKLKIMRILLKQGVLPTSFTKRGTFQVCPTLVNGNCKAIEILLNLQIDFNSKDLLDGKTFMHYLALNSNSGLSETLKKHITKFNINALDACDTTPLYYAAKVGNVKMLKFLLAQGAEVDCSHIIDGFTPLHQSFAEYRPGLEEQYNKCAKILLWYKANPQFVAYQESKPVTIFDVVSGKKRIKPVIAQLALLESLGTQISRITKTKISLQQSSIKYLKRCQKMLKKKVAGSITVCNMLTCTRRKAINYLRHEERLRKLKNINYQRKLKKTYPYYYDHLKNRITKANWFLKSKETIYKVLCKLLRKKFNTRHLALDLIVELLDHEDLKSLYALSLNYDFMK